MPGTAQKRWLSGREERVAQPLPNPCADLPTPPSQTERLRNPDGDGRPFSASRHSGTLAIHLLCIVPAP